MARVQFVKFSKPLYWKAGLAYLNLDENKLREIKKKKCKVVISLPQGFTKPVSPENILKYGKKTEQIFLRPNEPMRMRGYFYELFNNETQERIKQDIHFWDYYN